MKTYAINEAFYSIQGEGIRAGTANLFLRFAGCNLQCREESEGFDCDTEFTSSRSLSTQEILDWLKGLSADCKSIILTGGEPALQLDDNLITVLKNAGYYLAIETNGTKKLPDRVDWITVSPKTAEHTIRQPHCDEVKYVRAVGQGIPKPSISADHYLLSPAFESNGQVKQETLEWCIGLVKQDPRWRFSVQLHKMLKQR